MARTYEAIASQTLSSTSTAVEFTSIPATYTDLIAVVQAKRVSGTNDMMMRLGNASVDTGNNYSTTYLVGNGTSATSGRTTSQTYILSGDSSTTEFCSSIIHIMSYANTNVYKTALVSTVRPDSSVIRAVGLWRSTSAITNIKFEVWNAASFTSGCTFSLFGIKAA